MVSSGFFTSGGSKLMYLPVHILAGNYLAIEGGATKEVTKIKSLSHVTSFLTKYIFSIFMTPPQLMVDIPLCV